MASLPRATPALVFTSEELTLLAGPGGEHAFPFAGRPSLDDAARAAVARGLVARGVLSASEPEAKFDVVDMALGVVLSADESLRMTIVYAPGDGDSRQEILWLKGDALVRQTVTPAGVHRFSTGDRSAVGAVLSAVMTFPVAGRSRTAAPETVARARLAEALRLCREDGAAAAALCLPQAAVYLEALATARRLTCVVVQRRDGDDRYEGDALTLVESAEHGLWLERGGDPVELQQVDVATARARVAALAGVDA